MSARHLHRSLRVGRPIDEAFVFLERSADLDRAPDVSGKPRLIVPGPAALLRLGAHAVQLLAGRMLTADGLDSTNQPPTVDVGPRLAALARRLTPLREGLESYRSSGRAR